MGSTVSELLAPEAPVLPAATSFPESDGVSLEVHAWGPDADPDGFDALADVWDQLVDRSGSRAFFMRLAWQKVWWRNLGLGERWITAYRRLDTGELVGILPLYRLTGDDSLHDGRDQLSIVGCIEVSDYLDVIVACGWEDCVYRAFLDWLEGPTAPPWEVVDLCNLPSSSTTWQVLPVLAEARGLSVRVFQEDVAPAIELPDTYEDYLEHQVASKQRHEIRRKQRRIEREAEVGVYIVGSEHDLRREVGDFIALQKASQSYKREFMTPDMEHFFHEMSRDMFDAGTLSLMFLTLNGEKAAALLAFSQDGHYLLYNSGFRPDLHYHLSPGWVILSYALQYAIVSGHKVFDFMQGDEEYKGRFGAVDHPVMRVILEH